MPVAEILPRPLSEAWKADALCRRVGVEVFVSKVSSSKDIFFPAAGDSVAAELAKQVCSFCPVREPCLDWALRRPEYFGIWGGMSPNERAKLRKGSLTDPPLA